jgi:uncharacterized protein (DUF983 family)
MAEGPDFQGGNGMSTPMPLTTRQRWLALLRQRCPVCGRAPLFRGAVTMHETCLGCGLRFEREPGYFMGSMYISYGLAIAVLAVFMGAIYWVWPDLDLRWNVLIAAALFLPLVPWTWRWSRTLWIFFDYWGSPNQEQNAKR